MKKNVVMYNVVFALMLQLVSTISGFILPRIIIEKFGSDTNGLVSSITQFLNYIALLEGGVSGVIMASLYRPLRENDKSKISGIISATKCFFKKIGIIYIVYTLCLSIAYPMFIKTKYNWWYVSLLCMVLGIRLFIQYFYSLSYQILIKADRKVYFVSLTQIIITILNIGLVLLNATLFNDIIIIYFFSGVIYIVQPILYTRYVNKHYCIDQHAPCDNQALSQRWDGLGQNIAYFIHSNTDIVVLTVFSSLESISVYSVYFMVASALKNLVSSVSGAILPSIGNIIAGGDKKEIIKAFGIYEYVVYLITSFLFSCGIVLVTPFVSIYTSNITDVNYIQPIFGVFLLLSEMICSIRNPYINVAYASNRFKETAKYAYCEALLNIIISIFLVSKFGLIGVALGTCVAMAFRMFAHVLYLRKNILNRRFSIFLKNLLIFSIGTVLVVLVSKTIGIGLDGGYFAWFISGLEVAIVALFVFAFLSVVFYRIELIGLINLLKKK